MHALQLFLYAYACTSFVLVILSFWSVGSISACVLCVTGSWLMIYTLSLLLWILRHFFCSFLFPYSLKKKKRKLVLVTLRSRNYCNHVIVNMKNISCSIVTRKPWSLELALSSFLTFYITHPHPLLLSTSCSLPFFGFFVVLLISLFFFFSFLNFLNCLLFLHPLSPSFIL